jgi:membrane protease YdiL (CAAX protease family)
LERARRRLKGFSAPSVRRALVETIGVAAAIVGFSWVLFTLIKTEPSAAFRELFKSPERLEIRSGYIYISVALAALWEETAFRWYLLNRLEEALRRWRWARALAIVATAAFWACGHAAVTAPFWVKLVQIFVVGCLLAWRFPVIGLSGCILAHLTMNLAAVSLP